MAANDNRINISKEPWLAVTVSMLWAGTGQVYSGRIRRGSLLICVEVVLLLLGSWLVLSLTGDIRAGFGLLLLLAIVRIWNLFDAHKCARTTNSEDFETSRKQDKDPWLAVFLSYLIPGLGQLYIRKWFWGGTFVGCFVALRLAGRTNPLVFVGLSALLSALVCYHAYVSSPVRREPSKKTIAIVVAILVAIGLSPSNEALFRNHFVEPFKMTAGSMKPTVVAADRILVWKWGQYSPQRGDIVAFRNPQDRSLIWLKRIAALGGESIEIRGKNLYVDNKRIESRQFETIEMPLPSEDFRTRLPAVDFGQEGSPFKVPLDSVFVLGDNSGNSFDSRYFGPIPQADLVGRAYKIFWPLHRIGPIE
ncbi:MAG: signal peptidase I [Planctomycetota bacterium]|jgi:signal peptidase I